MSDIKKIYGQVVTREQETRQLAICISVRTAFHIFCGLNVNDWLSSLSLLVIINPILERVGVSKWGICGLVGSLHLLA